MNILITGVAGFIGYHTCLKFLNKNFKVIGIDNINDYYDIKLKKKRLENLSKFKNFNFYKIDISKKKNWQILKKKKIDKVIHLAAQAGVRFSLLQPSQYVEANLIGTYNLIEFCKNKKINHIIFSSSSSVYGNNKKLPFNEKHFTDNPIQFYAATKKSCEVMISSYCQLYSMNADILRFFTVYGPFGRPDMALFKFVKKISENKPIEVYNKGNHSRDFTYIDDVVNAIYQITFIRDKEKKINILNVCSGKKIKITKMVSILQSLVNKKIKIRYKKLQKGDMVDTFGDNIKLKRYIEFKKTITIEEGIKNFIDWYKNFYKVKL